MATFSRNPPRMSASSKFCSLAAKVKIESIHQFHWRAASIFYIQLAWFNQRVKNELTIAMKPFFMTMGTASKNVV